MPDDPIREQVIGALVAAVCGPDAKDVDLTGVGEVADAVLAVATPLIRAEPSALVDSLTAIEDDTEGWHITVENHAGMSITVYAETWKAAMDMANAGAFAWFRAQPEARKENPHA
jgi:hypothetical protein